MNLKIRKIQIVLAVLGDLLLLLMFYFKWLEKSPIHILTIIALTLAIPANVILIRNIRAMKGEQKNE